MMKIEVTGKLPQSPKAIVKAVEAFAMTLAPMPEEAVMALCVAFIKLHRQHLPPGGDEAGSLAELIGFGFATVSSVWPDLGQPQLPGTANDNRGRPQ